jgi:hypothetical protein
MNLTVLRCDRCVAYKIAYLAFVILQLRKHAHVLNSPLICIVCLLSARCSSACAQPWERSFKFDHCFAEDSTQADVYSELGEFLIENALQG